jgi:hypothetical protein
MSSRGALGLLPLIEGPTGNGIFNGEAVCAERECFVKLAAGSAGSLVPGTEPAKTSVFFAVPETCEALLGPPRHWVVQVCATSTTWDGI